VSGHDWMLVAPWWKWPAPTDSAGGRLTRPVLQKYDTPKLVEQFLAHPQRCLAFVAEDLVHVTQLAPAIPPGSNGKPRRLTELQYVPDGTNTRKVFLDTHKRFYLVVCQLHCDAPGFPRASRGDVCEAGFVVRRRTTDIPAAGVREVSTIMRDISTARARLSVLDSADAQPMAMAGGARSLVVQRQRASTRALLALERQRLADWADRFGVASVRQGWFPSASVDKVGAWQAVDARPGEIAGEATYPLYPLVPPPNDPTHDGTHGTLYFGLLPTGTGETDDAGHARFDDQQYYEVVCYARRHKKPHPKRVPCPCPDGLFWSQPTEPYRLASHFDPVGTGRRPVTVQLPDIDALAAQATPALGVAFAKPKGSLLVTGTSDGKPVKKGRSTFPQICSFSIPLITIVATFVLELFLPVVILMFGLWFMLKLKFCIPPSVELAAGVTAEIDLDVSLSVEASLSAQVATSLNARFGDMPDAVTALKNDYSPVAGQNLVASLEGAIKATNGPSLTAGVTLEPEVAYS